VDIIRTVYYINGSDLMKLIFAVTIQDMPQTLSGRLWNSWGSKEREERRPVARFRGRCDSCGTLLIRNTNFSEILSKKKNYWNVTDASFPNTR